MSENIQKASCFLTHHRPNFFVIPAEAGTHDTLQFDQPTRDRADNPTLLTTSRKEVTT